MLASEIGSTVDAISPAAVRQVLAVVRHVESRARGQPSRLLELRLVDARLREMGVTRDDQNRRWALAGLLEGIVSEQLAERRAASGATPPPAGRGATRATELQLLAEDFRAGDHERECWATLYVRFISPVGPTMDEVARAAGVGRVTLARRLNEGLMLLAEALRQRELTLLQDAGPALWLPPAERVRVAGAPAGAAAVSVAAARKRLLAAVRAPQHPGLDLAPAEAALLASEAPVDLVAYHVSRVAAWAAPGQRLDRRFVRLTLQLDDGEQSGGGRWRTRAEYDDLASAWAAASDPVVALLGPPGSGKSTLLRRLELDSAVAALRGESDQVGYFVPLGQYRADAAGCLPEPARWLADRWQERAPELPSLDQLLRAGRLVLLLDGLNELPHRGPTEYHERVAAWRRFLVERLSAVPGNRAVVSCRSLDYSAPLSSEALRVPHLAVEPLSEAQMRAFLAAQRPALAEQLWAQLLASGTLEAFRLPYALMMLVGQVDAGGQLPGGNAALFTGLVRRALAREIERATPHFEPGALLDARDIRQVTHARWRGAYDLPERGALFPGLTELAWGLQQHGLGTDGGLVQVSRIVAADWSGPANAEALLAAGQSLGLLDEDLVTDDVSFQHQLLQEYFAARRLAQVPQPDLVRSPWRSADVEPTLPDILRTLPTGEALPPLPGTGWEETTLLASALSPEPEAFLTQLMEPQLALAGRAAAQPDVRPRLSARFLDQLRSALAARSRDPAADLRARIAAGYALGALGDPRFERRAGPDGEYLWPPWVNLPGGSYPVGRAEPLEALGQRWWARYPPHRVRLGPVALGQFPVTNAEWACFMAAGGYEDARWWSPPGAKAWRAGEDTTAGIHQSVRDWVARYRAEPELLEATRRAGTYPTEVYERWRRRLAMSPSELEQHLATTYPSERRTAPRGWQHRELNHPAQPVTGITWYEAAAYCSWLAVQSDAPVRLPADVELEAAARGSAGQDFPWGNAFDPLSVNCVATHLQGPTPIGVFPDGDSPAGACDLVGNVEAWTSTLAFGFNQDETPPRRRWSAALEVTNVAPGQARVVRGGAWLDNESRVHAAYGSAYAPDLCPESVGLRLVCGPAFAATVKAGRRGPGRVSPG